MSSVKTLLSPISDTIDKTVESWEYPSAITGILPRVLVSQSAVPMLIDCASQLAAPHFILSRGSFVNYRVYFLTNLAKKPTQYM